MEHVFDKTEFFDTIKRILKFGAEEKALTGSIRETEIEIDAIQSKIDAIKDELIKSLIMLPSSKAKRKANIEKYQNQIEEKKAFIAEVKEQIKNLNLRCFNCEEMPSVYLGTFPQGKDGEEMPLEWDVLLCEQNFVHLVTKHVIKQMKYADELVDTPWKNSKIRHWLNSEFYENAFNDEEKAIIIEKELANPGCPAYKTPGSDNTRDKVFLPSITEVKNYSKYDMDRIATPTEYAKNNGLFVSVETGGSYWWLRNNGGNMYNASIVNFNGYVFEYGFYIVDERYGVRPNIWIRLQ